MQSLKVYFYFQYKYLIFLFGIFWLPLVLFDCLSPYPISELPYVFLLALFLSQYVFSKDKNLQAKLKPKVIEKLRKKWGRTPSTNEWVAFSQKIISFRGISQLICGVAIIIWMLFSP